ncbi:Casp-like protein, partial [Thalictrum thalictroides]
MKKLIGGPGTLSGLILRIGQFLFAAASIGTMASSAYFSSFTAYSYLIASMGLQVLWSSGLACLDVYALRFKTHLHNPLLVSLFAVGDW